MDQEFTCAWERMHGVRLSDLSRERQQRLLIDRRPGRGVLDLRASLGELRRAA